MISLGLSPGIANGTNRLAAVAGLATATWRFQQAGAIPWKLTLKATLPMVLGASLGALGATALADEWITLAVAISLIFVLIILITKPTQLLQEPAIENENIEPKLGILFYTAGPSQSRGHPPHGGCSGCACGGRAEGQGGGNHGNRAPRLGGRGGSCALRPSDEPRPDDGEIESRRTVVGGDFGSCDIEVDLRTGSERSARAGARGRGKRHAPADRGEL